MRPNKMWLKQLKPEVKTVYDPRIGHPFQRTYWVSVGREVKGKDEARDRYKQALQYIKAKLTENPEAIVDLMKNCSNVTWKMLGDWGELLKSELTEYYPKKHLLEEDYALPVGALGFFFINRVGLDTETKKQALNALIRFFLLTNEGWTAGKSYGFDGVGAALLQHYVLTGDVGNYGEDVVRACTNAEWEGIISNLGYDFFNGAILFSRMTGHDLDIVTPRYLKRLYDTINDTHISGQWSFGSFLFHVAHADIDRRGIKAETGRLIPLIILSSSSEGKRYNTFRTFKKLVAEAATSTLKRLAKHPHFWGYIHNPETWQRLGISQPQIDWSDCIMDFLDSSYHFYPESARRAILTAKIFGADSQLPRFFLSLVALYDLHINYRSDEARQWLELPTKPIEPKGSPLPTTQVKPDPSKRPTNTHPADDTPLSDKTIDWINKAYAEMELSCGCYDLGSTYKATHAETIAKRLLSRPDFLDLLKNSEFYPPQWETWSYRQKLEYMWSIVSGLFGVWAETAMDNHGVSIALQIAACYEFGLPDQALNYIRKQPMFNHALKFYANNQRFLRAFLRELYEFTQKRLDEWGIGETVKLCRGVQRLRLNEGQSFTANPLSSWTINPSIARAPYFSKKGTVIYAEVPRRAIISFMSGLGCLNEDEVIVIGAHGVGTYEHT